MNCSFFPFSLKLSFIICVLLMSLNTGLAFADESPKLFDGLGQNIEDSFTGSNLFLHAAGFASTGILIKLGTDAQVHDTFHNNYNSPAIPGAIIGSGVGAVATAGWLYFSGKNSGDHETLGAAFSVGQASIITVTYVVLLKFTTGRAHPTNSWSLNSQEQSEQFQFGFLRNGVTAYGWPSGHVSNTVAVTSALAHYYPNKPWLVGFGIGLSAYMLYTVSAFDSGQMHWFSDGVAGAFMGYAIGSSVGKNFRRQIDGTGKDHSSINWMPIVSSNFFGLNAIWEI